MNNTSAAHSRISTIDMMKGIGILLLILSHSISGAGSLKTWIFSFHMPIFFVCTGYLTYKKYPSPKDLKGNLWSIIVHKARKILIPYFTFSLVYLFFLSMLKLVETKAIPEEFVIYGLTNIFTLAGYASMWFLPCMLIAECFFLILYADFAYYGLFSGFVFSIIMNIILNGDTIGGLYGMFLKSTAAFVFICFGFLLSIITSKTAFGQEIVNRNALITVPIFLLVLGGLLSEINGFTAIGTYEFGNVGIYYASACSTILGFFLLFSQIPNLPMISFFGRNSIVILCTNNIIIECLRLIDLKLAGDFFLSHGMFGNILFAILVTLLEVVVIYFSRKYCPGLFGLPKQKRWHSKQAN